MMRSGVVAVGALCLVQFVDVMGVTVVVTALPTMLADLQAPASSATTVSTGYAMFFGGLLMLGARLGDRIGHRRAIVGSFVGFAAASFLAASAGSIAVLVIGRCLQGAAAAVSVPSALRLVTTITAEGPARRQAVAAWSATGAAAGATGFIVGGVLTELANWRLIFWMNLPLVAILALLILWAVPRDVPAPASKSLDLAGSATLIAAVMAVIVGMTLVPQPGRWRFGVALIVLAGGLVATLIAIERRAADPVLPAAALRLPTLRRGALASLLNTATTSSVLTLATLYLQDVRHLTPVAGAEALLPFSLAVVAGSALAAPVLRNVRPARAVTLGLALIAVADGSLAVVADVGHALSSLCCRRGSWDRVVVRRRYDSRDRRSHRLAQRCFRRPQHRRAARHCNRDRGPAAHRQRRDRGHRARRDRTCHRLDRCWDRRRRRSTHLLTTSRVPIDLEARVEIN